MPLQDANPTPSFGGFGLRDVRQLEAATKRRPLLAEFFVRLVREKPLGLAGGVIVLMLLFSGMFAGVLAPYDMTEIHIWDTFAGPSMTYLLGADQLGRDILSRLIYGARVSLIVGLAGTTVSVLVSVIIGVPSGYLAASLTLWHRGLLMLGCPSPG